MWRSEVDKWLTCGGKWWIKTTPFCALTSTSVSGKIHVGCRCSGWPICGSASCAGEPFWFEAACDTP